MLLNINGDLFELFGIFCNRSKIIKDCLIISLCNDDESYISYVAKLMKRIFGKDPKKKANKDLILCDNSLVLEFRNIFYGLHHKDGDFYTDS